MAKGPRQKSEATVTVVAAWPILADGELIATGEEGLFTPADAEVLKAAGHSVPDPAPAAPSV